MSYQLAKSVGIQESPCGYCGALTSPSPFARKERHTTYVATCYLGNRLKHLDGKTLTSPDVFLNTSNFRLLDFSWCRAGCKAVGRVHKLARAAARLSFLTGEFLRCDGAARQSNRNLTEGRISLFSGCFCKWHVMLGLQVSGVFFREMLEVQTCSV